MGKLNIPKAKQIVGLRKAIANRKTPRQFIPSLKKRLAKLTGAAILIFVLWGFSARPLYAQAPVQIVPTQQVLAPAGTACTGATQTFPVNNRNQTQHYAYVHTNSSVTNLVMQIQGIDASGNLYIISDTSTTAVPITGNNASLPGSGYFPQIQVSVFCLPASTGMFSLNYSGAEATTNVNVGSYLITQQDKTISSQAAANVSYSPGTFQTPFGNSYGVIYFQYNGTGPAGSALNINCQTQTGTGATAFIYSLATTTAIEQIFSIPPFTCPNVTISYTTGGASAALYSLDYVFLPPGANATRSYTHIANTAAVVVKAGPGVVHTVVVGTPATGTISLFDLASANCTGTPSTNTVSVITATATFPSAPMIYDSLFTNGICVKTSAVMDITVNSQ
jgi:hypothetical protein